MPDDNIIQPASNPTQTHTNLANGTAYCQQHGQRPFYIVCSCVLVFGEMVQHVERPTKNRPGEILCKRVEDHEPHEYRPLCSICAVNLGISCIGCRRTA